MFTELKVPSKVSVVIPCRNEEAHIADCVRSLFDMDIGENELTVIVVDGLSDDGTKNILLALQQEFQQLQVLDNAKRTTPYALNLGLKARAFDVGIILGAHATVDKDFLKANIETLRQDKSVACAGGVIDNVFASDQARYIGLAMSHPFGVGNAHFRTGAKSGYVDTVAFGAYRQEAFEAVGYFDEDLARNQDDEYNFRLIHAGFKIKLDTAIRSSYVVRSSYNRLFRQYFQYGYWKVFVNRKHRTITTWRQLIPAMWVAFLFFMPLVALVHQVFLWLLLAGVLAYFLAAIAASLALSKSLAGLIGVLKGFLILHFAYGLGYIKGIGHFILLNRMPTKKSESLTR